MSCRIDLWTSFVATYNGICLLTMLSSRISGVDRCSVKVVIVCVTLMKKIPLKTRMRLTLPRVTSHNRVPRKMCLRLTRSRIIRGYQTMLSTTFPPPSEHAALRGPELRLVRKVRRPLFSARRQSNEPAIAGPSNSSATSQTLLTQSFSTRSSMGSNGAKRSFDGDDQPSSKRLRTNDNQDNTSEPVLLPARAEEETEQDKRTNYQATSTKTNQTLLVQDVQLQATGYALELLSCPVLLLRPFLNLDIRAISIKDDECMFLSTLYHLHALDSVQRGFAPHPDIHVQPKALPQPEVAKRTPFLKIYDDAKIELGRQKLTLGKHLYTARSILGRGTNVIKAKSDYDKQSQRRRVYAMKISFQALKNATTKSEWGWVKNLLPKLRYFRDIPLTSDDGFPHERIKAFLDEHFESEGHIYEERVLCVICEDRLQPLLSLNEGVQFARVFCDVLQAHRWLYDHPGILRCDISMQNIMVHRKREYWRKADPTAQHRTGTLPFLARELLLGEVKKRRYRHDLESLFYVILCLCCRYTIRNGTTLELKATPVLENFQAPSQRAPFDEETANGTVIYGNFLNILKQFGDAISFPVYYPDEKIVPLPSELVTKERLEAAPDGPNAKEEVVLGDDTDDLDREMQKLMHTWLDDVFYSRGMVPQDDEGADSDNDDDKEDEEACSDGDYIEKKTQSQKGKT
ncbi:hypothetical protein D9758_007906 [Tetrapyrgos nigripes]|uniref:Fungal-type protein kinase domain-containing protein n=1 Tax=Tetrapyrgos nigripes TaxID=182062 RepID=A0A8H5FY22_9AGAR|nr:hypothetical protein D9758_007906 [Tetrapyrgos nigripes]